MEQIHGEQFPNYGNYDVWCINHYASHATVLPSKIGDLIFFPAFGGQANSIDCIILFAHFFPIQVPLFPKLLGKD